MELFYYLELKVLCLAIAAWIVYRMKTVSSGLETANLIFLKMVYITAGMIFVETVGFLSDGHEGTFFFYFNYVLGAIRIIQSVFATYIWLLYTYHFLHPATTIRRHTHLLIVSPALIFTAMVICSIHTGWVFYVDRDTNVFHLGHGAIIYRILTYGYFAVASHLTLLLFLKEKDKMMRSKYMSMLSFILFPIASGVITAIRPDLQIAWQFITFSLFFVFTELQFAQISRDGLTGINNRTSFNLYVRNLADYKGGKQIFLFMMDVNKFKVINDKYGHPEGDSALIETAKVIRKVFDRSGSYFARYGGDEFAAFVPCSESEAAGFKETLYDSFAIYNVYSGKPYQLTVSVGYAPMQGLGEAAVKDLIKRADAALYQEKKN